MSDFKPPVTPGLWRGLRKALPYAVAFWVVVAVLVWVAVAKADPQTWNDFPQLDSIAALSAGSSSTQIRCEGAGEWASDPFIIASTAYLGWTPTGYHHDGSTWAAVNPTSCGYAMQLVLNPTAPLRSIDYFDTSSYNEAAAIFLVLHEAGHIGGIINEHDTDCHALEIMPAALAQLQVPKAIAVALVADAWDYHDHEPADYTGPCS